MISMIARIIIISLAFAADFTIGIVVALILILGMADDILGF